MAIQLSTREQLKEIAVVRLQEEEEAKEEAALQGEEVEEQDPNKKSIPVAQQDELIGTVKRLELTYTSAIKILRHRQQFEEETIEIGRLFEDIPFADAALGISKAMTQVFHWASAKETKTLFGSHPPRILQVSSGPNGERVDVPIGSFEIPMLDDANCEIDQVRSGECFFSCKLKRKHEKKLLEMLALAEELSRSESLYREKALTFSWDGENNRNVLNFLKLNKKETLILPRHTEIHMQANLWTPIQQPEAAAKLGIPLKRAMLLYGTYGVGKTLAAHKTAHIALENKRTFIYVPNADHLHVAYLFASQVSPSVLFVEDIDQIANKKILSNVLDGVTTKGAGVYLVATTNHIDRIPAVLLRPGRFDMHLELRIPDQPAIIELIQLYAPQIKGSLKKAAEKLEGNIPAVIRECCERAKLYSLSRNSREIVEQDLIDAADGMSQEMERLRQSSEEKEILSEGDKLADALQKVVHNGSGREQVDTQ